MAKHYLLGIDFGTQGSKAMLCNQDGYVISYQYREHNISSPQVGWAEQNPEIVWWGNLINLVQDILRQSGVTAQDIKGIGVSSFVPGMVPLDKDGVPLRPGIMYNDVRSEEQVREIKSILKEAGYQEEQTGPFWTSSPIPQFLWVREHESRIARRTKKILTCGGYLNYKLTGNFVIDHSMKRTFAPLYDRQNDAWDEEVADLLGLKTSLLPDRVGWATDISGGVTAQAAEATGLQEGTPVIIGTADAFAEMVGAGLVVPGSAGLIYGSSMPLLTVYDQPQDAWQGYHCLPDLYFGGAFLSTGAALTRWFRDNFGQVEQEMEDILGESAYQLLDRQASRAPVGSDGLLIIPDFSSAKGIISEELCNGSILGLCTSHTRAHIFRALLEATALELRYQLEEMELEIDEMNAVGGGSRSPVWTQIVSDVLLVTQNVLEIPYGAPYGSAYLAGMGVELFEDTQQLREKWIHRTAHTITPNVQNHSIYDQKFTLYKKIRSGKLNGDS
jgi:xylulokinase